jgi:NAD(P)-dependent dehydrogenase (short-subunit alcohol dehydrogenase family)
LVTGASRGLGEGIARALARDGAAVMLLARDGDLARKVAGEIVDAGGTAEALACDVSDYPSVERAVADTRQRLGGLDILVNNAGGGRPFAEGAAAIPDEEWQATFALNLFAAVRLTNAVLPALRDSKVGTIINISSNASRMPFGPFAHYCAAKAALDMYSRALALDLGPQGIRVNVVSPGPVASPGGDEARRAFSEATGAPADAFAQAVPLGHLGSPDDVAEVVALLASDRGKWMTGANVLVDGGMTAR